MTNALRMQLGKVLDIALKFIGLSLVMFNLVGSNDVINETYVEWSLMFGLLVDALLLAWITATQKDSPSRIPDGMVAAPVDSVRIGTTVKVPPATAGPTGEAVVSTGHELKMQDSLTP